MEHILAAFEKGIDGVLIAGCLEGGCHFLEGNLRAKRRTEHLRDMLDEIGVGRERLRMVNLSAAMAPTFVQRVNEIVETIEGLGPNPLRRRRPSEKAWNAMIVASPKPVTELKQLIDRHKKVLFVGCGTCVTVCLAGGEREVGIAGYGVRMARKLAKQPVEIEQVTIERQCDNEFIKDLAPAVERNQAVVSFGCAAGVQALAERFPGQAGVPRRSTPSSSASWKSRPTGRKSAWAAATACWPSSAASAPSPAVPSTCSTARAAARPAIAAKSPPTSPAPGN